MKYKTPQELFDTVVSHLLTQMKKSEEGGTCLYRGPDGLKCAIGCLIPDEHYTNAIEESTFEMLSVHHRSILEKSGINPDSLFTEALMCRLQTIHDNFHPLKWMDELEELAQTEGLKFNWKSNGSL